MTREEQLAAAKAELARRQALRQGEGVTQGSILPIYKNPGQTGLDAIVKGQFDMSAGIPGSIMDAAKLPYDVYRGNVQMTDPNTGRTSDEAIGRSLEAASVLTPTGAATRSGSGAMVAGTKRNLKPPKAPSREALKNAAVAERKAAVATGASYPAAAIRKLPDHILYKNRSGGNEMNPVTAPKTMSIIEKWRTEPGEYATIQDLNNVRGMLWKVWKGDKEGTDGYAAREAINSIDEFIFKAGEAGKRAPKNAVRAPGSPKGSSPEAWTEAARLNERSMGNFAAGYRSKELNKMDYNAGMAADRAGSGMNVGNTYRQKASNALQSDKRLTGFSPEERQALRDLVAGTPGMNRARKWSNRLGGGGGMGQTLTTVGGGALGGGAMGGWTGAAIGAIPGLVGGGLKGLEGRLTRKAFEGVDDLVRQRSPLYQDMVDAGFKQTSRDVGAEAATRAGMASAGNAAENTNDIEPLVRLMTGNRNDTVFNGIMDALNDGNTERAILISNLAERKKQIAPGATMALVKKLGLVEQGQVY